VAENAQVPNQGTRVADLIAARHVKAKCEVLPDGKRIAALIPAETVEGKKAQNHVIFLENFFDELRRHTSTQAKRSAKPFRTIVSSRRSVAAGWVSCTKPKTAGCTGMSR